MGASPMRAGIRLLDVGREVLANALMGIPPIRMLRVRGRRTTSSSSEMQAEAVLDQFELLVAHIGKPKLIGTTVFEIGPGDAIPLGLLFLAAGAQKYVAI